MSLLTELIVRVAIIVSLTDIIELYLINKHHGVVTVTLAIGIIVVTIVPIVISIWYSLHRRGIK